MNALHVLDSPPHPSVRVVRPLRGSRVYTAQSIGVMEALAKRDQHDPAVRDLAFQAYTRAGGRSATDLQLVQAVEALVGERVTYMEDPANVELIASPRAILAMPQPYEDCDGFATLTASVLMALGLHPRFGRGCWHDDGSVDPWEHVFVQVDIMHGGKSRPVVLDATIESHRDIGALLGSLARYTIGEPITRSGVRIDG